MHHHMKVQIRFEITSQKKKQEQFSFLKETLLEVSAYKGSKIVSKAGNFPC